MDSLSLSLYGWYCALVDIEGAVVFTWHVSLT